MLDRLCSHTCFELQRILFVGFLAIGLPALASEPSKEWARFRGENATGNVEACNVAVPWKPEDVAWEISPPGVGNGSPIVFGNRVFLMSSDPRSAERYLLAYDLATGKELWKKSKQSVPYHLHRRASYASCTPAVNEYAVYFCWAEPEHVYLTALSHEGEELWTNDLGSYISQHGFGASPVLFGDKLILFNSQQKDQLPAGANPGQSKVYAFHAKTGETIWETPRSTTRACYGVPSLYETPEGKPALLFSNTGDGLFALDLETGKPLWNRQVFNKRCVSCPLVIGNLAIGTEGSGGGGNVLWGVTLDGEHEVKLRIRSAAPYVPTPVASDEFLYLWDDKGIVTCLRLEDSKVMWKERIGGNVSSSPVIAGGKLIGIAEDGTVTVLAASASFRELGVAHLEDTTRATPLVAKDFIIFRTDSKLLCIGSPQS